MHTVEDEQKSTCEKRRGRKRGREPTERHRNERERLGQVRQRISLQLVERKEVGRRTEEGRERRTGKLKQGFA